MGESVGCEGTQRSEKKMSIFLKMFNCSFKRGSSRGFWEGRLGGRTAGRTRGEERVRKVDEGGGGGGKVIRR